MTDLLATIDQLNRESMRDPLVTLTSFLAGTKTQHKDREVHSGLRELGHIKFDILSGVTLGCSHLQKTPFLATLKFVLATNGAEVFSQLAGIRHYLGRAYNALGVWL